ncbi:ATP-grasp fold amidoligase family protein, partial [Priestia megaterium]
DYYWVHREFPYKGIKPKIICEQLLKEESSEDIKDYKFLCFDGEVKCSFVCSNRNASTGLNVDFYDREWNKMPFERHYPRSDMHIPKPNHYEKMIELSERLSKDFAFVRVDFYESNGRLYFGELTFYPGSGYESFNPYSYDLLLGGWIDLSKVNN